MVKYYIYEFRNGVTIIKAKEYLMQISKLNKLIQTKQEKLAEITAKAGAGSVRYGGDGSTNTSKDIHKQERLYLKIIDLKDVINREIEEYLTKRYEILRTLANLKDHNEIDVLYKRYFKFMSWEEIAKDMCYTERYIYNIHIKALRHVQELI